MNNKSKAIDLFYITPISILIKAIRICYKSKGDNMGPKDKKLIKNVFKMGHLSVAEHIKIYFRTNDPEIRDWFLYNPYSYLKRPDNTIVTNLRVIWENRDKLDYVVDLLNDTEYGFLFKEGA